MDLSKVDMDEVEKSQVAMVFGQMNDRRAHVLP